MSNASEMSNFVPGKEVVRGTLITFFHLKQTPAESRRLLVDAYGKHAPSQDTCERWFKRFKSGDFGVDNKERGRPSKKFEDEELQALLDEYPDQTEKELAKALNVSQACISQRLTKIHQKWVESNSTNSNLTIPTKRFKREASLDI